MKSLPPTEILTLFVNSYKSLFIFVIYYKMSRLFIGIFPS